MVGGLAGVVAPWPGAWSPLGHQPAKPWVYPTNKHAANAQSSCAACARKRTKLSRLYMCALGVWLGVFCCCCVLVLFSGTSADSSWLLQPGRPSNQS
jgi:hypothetical protein